MRGVCYLIGFLLFSSLAQATVVVVDKHMLIKELHWDDLVQQHVRGDLRDDMVTITQEEEKIEAWAKKLSKEEEAIQKQEQEVALLQGAAQEIARQQLQCDTFHLQEGYVDFSQVKKAYKEKVAVLHNQVEALCAKKSEEFDEAVIAQTAQEKGWDLVLDCKASCMVYVDPTMQDDTAILRSFDKRKKGEFHTLQERKDLFKMLGITYLPNVRVDYKKVLMFDPYTSDWYSKNKKQIDQYSEWYKTVPQEQYIAPIYIKWISDALGYGMFADRDLHVGEAVGEYTGSVRRVVQSQLGGKEDRTYAWGYPLDLQKDGIDTTDFRHSLMIDGKYAGNEMRFINHSYTPNTLMVYMIGSDQLVHGLYVVTKPIKKDEQLTVNYGKGYWKSRGKIFVEL